MPDAKYGPLVLSFLKIGLFGFGGGYAILPLISHEIVSSHGWLTAGEFADMVAISQMTPGPVALNTATYVGFALHGLAAAALATAAVCLPPFAIMYGACRFFLSLRDNRRFQGAMRLLRPAVTGLVLAAALFLLNRESFVDWKSGAIFAATFALTVWRGVHPILLLAGAGAAGWLLYG